MAVPNKYSKYLPVEGLIPNAFHWSDSFPWTTHANFLSAQHRVEAHRGGGGYTGGGHTGGGGGGGETHRRGTQVGTHRGGGYMGGTQERGTGGGDTGEEGTWGGDTQEGGTLVENVSGE